MFATFNEMVHVYHQVSDYEGKFTWTLGISIYLLESWISERKLKKSLFSLNGEALSPAQVSKVLYG